VDPSVRGSRSTDQPPVAAQPHVAAQLPPPVRKRVTIHESSDDDDDDDDELVLTRRPSFVAATATAATEAVAKVEAGADAGGAMVRRPKLDSCKQPGEQQGEQPGEQQQQSCRLKREVKREVPPPWPQGAYEPELTRTPRRLRRVRTGCAYQPPAYCTYHRRRRAACLQGPAYCTYWVRVPASGVPYVPRTVAIQV